MSTRKLRLLVLTAALPALMVGTGSGARADSWSDGVKWYHAGDIDKALPAFQQTVQANPNDDAAHYYLGRCFDRKNDRAHAAEEFRWLMTHSSDPQMRIEADKALKYLSQPPARPAAPAKAATAPANAAIAPAKAATATAKPTAPQPLTTAGHEISPEEQNIQRAKARIIDEKIKMMRKAQMDCAAVDRKLAEDNDHDWQTMQPRAAMRSTALRRNDAERRKQAILDAAKQRADAWDSALTQLTYELEHPGKKIQLVPQNINPYVKNFMNTGQSDDDEPFEIVPLRATAKKITPAKKN